MLLWAIYHFSQELEIRLDNEWRDQHENLLRSGSDDALFSHIGVSYYPKRQENLEIFLAYDKPWDEQFGTTRTPGRGDQLSLGVNFGRWLL